MKKTREPHTYQLGYHCKCCGLAGCIETNPRQIPGPRQINTAVMKIWCKSDHDERHGGACASDARDIILHLRPR